MSTLFENQTVTKEIKSKATNKISEEMRLQIIAAYELEKLEAEKIELEKIELEKLEAEKIELEKIELEKLEAEKIELEKLEAKKEAAKLEAKAIRAKKVESNNDALSELLPFDVAFKYAIKDINTNGINYYLKAVQKDVFNQIHFEQLIKSINLCLKQFSVKDIEKYVSDNRCTMPSKFIDAVVLGSCKSAKSFETSKAKVLPQNNKLS